MPEIEAYVRNRDMSKLDIVDSSIISLCGTIIIKVSLNDMTRLTRMDSRSDSSNRRQTRSNGNPSRSTRVPVKLITEDSQARLIFDPMRREILRLLSRKALTQKELAEILGITAPSVDHHLKALLRGNLISVVRKEAGPHGIMQKWYLADAEAFIVERDRLRPEIRRYFMPMDIERTRGVVAALSILKGGVTPSTGYMESLTRQICTALANASKSYTGIMQDDPELTIHSLYVNALKQVLT